MAAFVGKLTVIESVIESGTLSIHFAAVTIVPLSIILNIFFAGNHECVSVINNYVEKESVYYFTRKQPLESEAKLPVNLAKPIHSLVMSVSSIFSLVSIIK